MKPKGARVAVIAVAAILLVAAGVSVALLLHGASLRRTNESLSQALSEADREIATGAFERGRAPVSRAAGFALDRTSWLSVCRRAFAIAKGADDYEFLRTIALRATKSLPGSPELHLFEVIADTRTARYAEAVDLADRYLSDPSFASFKTEALLRAYPTIDPQGVKLDPANRSYLEAITSRDPRLFEALAGQTGNDDFLFDAALLHAYSGDLSGAYRLLVSLRSPVPPEVGMLLSYDAGEFDAAMNWYNAIPESTMTPGDRLVAADIAMNLGRTADTAARYNQVVAVAPSYSWVPYVNLAWIAEQSNDPAAIEHLRAGYVLFPNQREVALSLADLYRRNFEPERALSVLTPYLSSNPWDLDANLLSMRLSGASSSPEGFKSRLWELFYHSESGSPEERDRIARYLGWYLFGLHDDQGVGLVLKQMQPSAGEEWFQFYEGIRAAAAQNPSQAIEDFQKAAQLHDRWETRYDIGFLQLQSGDYAAAIDSFEKADLTLQESATVIQSPARAQIHVELAYALYGQGNTEAAKRELAYALDIDQSNLKGNLLLQKLDSEGQK